MKNQKPNAAYSAGELNVCISSIGNDLDQVEEFLTKEESLDYFVINI